MPPAVFPGFKIELYPITGHSVKGHNYGKVLSVMAEQRRVFTKEFKQQAVQLTDTGTKPVR
mgnify:CR=1 FL=1|jgi:hypothetical protein